MQRPMPSLMTTAGPIEKVNGAIDMPDERAMELDMFGSPFLSARPTQFVHKKRRLRANDGSAVAREVGRSRWSGIAFWLVLNVDTAFVLASSRQVMFSSRQ